MSRRTTVVMEYILFMKQKKAYWMIPIAIVFLLLSAIIVLGSTTAAPFIYTLF